MSERELVRWFEDFRSRGDLAALERVFDRTAPELLRLASHLAPDLAEAEDLVQATFVTAIERAAIFEAERDLGAWLTGILAGHARNAARRRGRRADPRELEREAGEEPARALERREFSEALETALAALPAHYREVLVAHLFEGERAVDIARASGRAPGTVRMQIARGLEQLRRALPAGAFGVALVAEPGARGLAAVRAAVMHEAGAASVALAGGTLTTVTGIGGLALGIKLALGATLMAGLLVCTWWLNDTEAERAPRLVEESRVVEARSSIGIGAQPTLPDKPDVSAEQTAAAALRTTAGLRSRIHDPRAPGWWLVGEIRGIGRALDTPLSLRVTARDGDRTSVDGSAAGDGPYAIDLGALLDAPLLGSRELLIEATHEAFERLTLPLSIDLTALRAQESARKEVRADLALVAGRGFRGRVLRPDGSPAEAAEVSVLLVGEDGRPRMNTVGGAHTDPDGRFVVMVRQAGPCIVLAFGEGSLPASMRSAVPASGFEELGDLLLEPGSAEIRGRVRLPASVAGQRVLVVAWREGPSRERVHALGGAMVLEGERFVPGEQATRSLPAGEFTLSGLDAGATYTLTIAGIEQHSSSLWGGAIKVRAPAEDVSLGHDIGVLTVELRADARLPEACRLTIESEHGGMSCRADAQGRVVALVHPQRDYRVIANAAGFAATEVMSLAVSRPIDARLTLALRSRADELASLGLELALVDGYGLVHPRVYLHRRGAEPARYRRPADFERRNGALWFDHLEPGAWEIAIETEPSDSIHLTPCYYSAVRLELDLPPGSSVRERVALPLGGLVCVSAEGMAGGDLQAKAELLDATASPVEVRYYWRGPAGVGQGPTIRTGVRSLLHPPLLPGTYELRADLAGHRCEPLHFTLAAGSTQELTLHFTPE